MAQRKRHTGQFKARVAVEAIAGHKTVNEIATEYGIHPSQVNKWKKQAPEQLPEALVFKQVALGRWLTDVSLWRARRKLCWRRA